MGFDRFCICIDYLRSNNNELIAQSTEEIEEMKRTPGFVEYLIDLIMQGSQELYVIQAAINLSRQIAKFWENDEFYIDRSQIKKNLLIIAASSTGTVLSNISYAISIIGKADYPNKWPEFNQTLIEFLNEPEVEITTIESILTTVNSVVGVNASSTILETGSYWDEVSMNLLSSKLSEYEESECLIKCFVLTLQLIITLISYDISDYYKENMNKLFPQLLALMELPGIPTVKKEICVIIKHFTIRYLTDIQKWGQSSEPERSHSEEEIIGFHETWLALLQSVFSVVKETSNEDTQVIIAGYNALSAIARSTIKEDFFLANDCLSVLCEDVLIPAVSLCESDLEEFNTDYFQYFQKDIQGPEGETKRKAAYDFLKVLCRNFRPQLMESFLGLYGYLRSNYESNPNEFWYHMDTAIFIIGAISASRHSIWDGVIEVVEGFNLIEFLDTFILPFLSIECQYPVLQADAIKFYVEFRNVIPLEVTLAYFPSFLGLLESPQPPICLYATYFIERILSSHADELTPALLSQFDFATAIARLFKLFVIDEKETVESAAKCMMRILIACQTNFETKYIIGIVSTIIKILEPGNRLPQNAQFNHYLFEIIAACVTKSKADIVAIEEKVIPLLNSFHEHDISDFIPYTFQLFAAFLRAYPEGSNVSQFYIDQIESFLGPELWQPMGNIPGLSMLIGSYCIKLPDIIANYSANIFEIAERLLSGSRTHIHAFNMFTSMMQYLPPEILLSLLPQMFAIAVNELLNGNANRYKPNFALFMCNACSLLEPNNVINSLGSDIDTIVSNWGIALQYIRGRIETENAVVGTLKLLSEGSNLPESSWRAMFVGLITMIDRPKSILEDELQTIKDEEIASQEFDHVFNKLSCLDISERLHPELAGVDLIQKTYTELAEISHRNPGMIIRALDAPTTPDIRKAVERNCEKFQLTIH